MKKAKAKKKLRLSESKHPVRKALNAVLEMGEESALMADGFEDAIVGLSCSQPGRPTLVVYDYQKCVDVLMKRDKMSYEEAQEFLDFNTVGAWMGESTPVFINTLEHVLDINGMLDALHKKAKKKK